MPSTIIFCRKILKSLWLAAKGFYNENYDYQASTLSFVTLFALIPTISVILYIFSFFTVFNNFINFFENYIYLNFLPEAALSVKDYLHSFSLQAQQLPIIGIIFLFLSVILLLLSIDKIFNGIFSGSTKKRHVGARLSSWVILLFIMLCIVMLAFVSVLYGLPLFNFIINSFLLASFYIFIPCGYLDWRKGLLAGSIVAILFEIGNKIFGFYILYLGNYKYIYGALALFPIFLLWLYISWSFVLYGALFIREYGNKSKAAT